MSPANINASAILAAIERAREEAKADNRALREEIAGLRSKIQEVAEKGCGQAWQHKTHEEHLTTHDGRLGALERADSERHGRAVVTHGLVSALISVAAVFVGRLFK